MPASPTRCLAVGLAATAAAGGLEAWLLPVAQSGTGEPRFDELLVRVCAATGVLGVAWLWLVAAVTVVEALRGCPRATRGVPSAVRRWVLAACGVGLTAGLATPAAATPGEVHTDRGPTSSLAGLPLPDRAVGLPGRASIGTGALTRARPHEVVVRPGDTLWAIAGRHLDDPHRWPEIYAANAGVIGPDPGLIHPSTRLRLPADRPQETP